jgi:hypothetical protein
MIIITESQRNQLKLIMRFSLSSIFLLEKVWVVVQNVVHHILCFIYVHFTRVNQISCLELDALLERDLDFLEFAIWFLGFVLVQLGLYLMVDSLQLMNVFVEVVIYLIDMVIVINDSWLFFDLLFNFMEGLYLIELLDFWDIMRNIMIKLLFMLFLVVVLVWTWLLIRRVIIFLLVKLRGGLDDLCFVIKG